MAAGWSWVPSRRRAGAYPVLRLERLKQEYATVGVDRFTARTTSPGLIRHIVLFRYREAVSVQQKADVIREFLALKILSERRESLHPFYRTGSGMNGKGLDQCFEQGFIVTFNLRAAATIMLASQ
jgi:hypothetical protein